MDRVYTIGICLVAVLALGSRRCNAVQSCEDKALKECVVQYASGFADPKYQKLDDLKLHCLLDKKLAICANKYLNQFSSSAFLGLAKAALSYVVFEKKLKVCRLYKYKRLAKKLDRVSGDKKADRIWRKRIDRLLHPSKIPKCAKQVDKECVREYAKRMRKNPNLCENIPFKSKCLLEGTKTCKATILTDLLDVFPYEANKVLAVFCQKAQDSG
ncbi:uncharacterized protein LOC116307537 [Actinia tenebrosa]|uniref:Uncharacterized protein LOC116307537 n=1 Tax=Actinia tenebrosa TaxID=6105 RepID=A0A6P8J269_ACTTE|nr:uncharacterized protein LOC116307537 [Actinia tenebrosa]